MAGDTEALADLLEQARPQIYGWAIQKIDDADDAEDITQLVLLRVFNGIATFRGDCKLSSWLYRITANEVSAFHRNRARPKQLLGAWVPEVQVQDSPPYKPESLDEARACGVVRNVACALPPLQLAAFRLVDLDGLRPCEAARALGRTRTNLRSSLCRARRRIRDLVFLAQRELAEDLSF